MMGVSSEGTYALQESFPVSLLFAYAMLLYLITGGSSTCGLFSCAVRRGVALYRTLRCKKRLLLLLCILFAGQDCDKNDVRMNRLFGDKNLTM